MQLRDFNQSIIIKNNSSNYFHIGLKPMITTAFHTLVQIDTYCFINRIILYLYVVYVLKCLFKLQLSNCLFIKHLINRHCKKKTRFGTRGEMPHCPSPPLITTTDRRLRQLNACRY